MLGDMLGVAVHSRETLVQGLEILQGLPQANAATVVLRAGRGRRPNRQSRRPANTVVAGCGGWNDHSERAVPFCRKGDSCHRPGSGWAAVAGVTRRDLERRSQGPAVKIRYAERRADACGSLDRFCPQREPLVAASSVVISPSVRARYATPLPVT